MSVEEYFLELILSDLNIDSIKFLVLVSCKWNLKAKKLIEQHQKAAALVTKRVRTIYYEIETYELGASFKTYFLMDRNEIPKKTKLRAIYRCSVCKNKAFIPELTSYTNTKSQFICFEVMCWNCRKIATSNVTFYNHLNDNEFDDVLTTRYYNMVMHNK